MATFLAILAQKHAARNESLNQGHSREVVFAAQFFETHNAVDGNSIFKENQRWQHLDLQLLNKEGGLFCVQSHKPSFGVSNRNLLQMHVNNLAALEALVEKGAHNVVCLGHRRQKLLLDNLCVRAVAKRLVHLLLLVCFFAGGKAFGCSLAHLSLFVLTQVKVGVFFVLLLLLFVLLVNCECSCLPVFLLQSRFCHRGLVLDRFFHYHLRE